MTETTENIELKAFEFMKELSGNVDETQSIKNFTATSEELNSLFNGVALRYLSGKSIFELKGKDTLDFLNRIATNSLKNLQKGQLQRTFFTTEKGRIIDLATVANFEDYNLLICNKENKDKIYSWISRYIIADDVTIKDIQNKYDSIARGTGNVMGLLEEEDPLFAARIANHRRKRNQLRFGVEE